PLCPDAGLGGRHLRLLRRQPLGQDEARAADQSRQDHRRCLRRIGRLGPDRRCRGLAVERARHVPARAGDTRHGRGHPFDRRRSVREPHQAPRQRQGFRPHVSGPRRRLRPPRWRVRRTAAVRAGESRARSMKQVAILGATGSIGASALDVVARHPQRYRASALTASRNVDALVALCRRFAPDLAVIAEESLETTLREKIAAAGLPTRVASGREGLREAATRSSSEIVIAAIVGSAGLDSTLAAARAGKRLLLANKEAVVMAGRLLFDALRASAGELIPIDSEHNAIFQCLPNPRVDLARAGVRKVVLTASGGPFRGKTRAGLGTVTPDQACAHPNWRMGRKISVDSATLMNKGLEVIEAHWLFGASAAQIEVVVHPQSIVHSLVEYADGSVLAQLGNPDMRT